MEFRTDEAWLTCQPRHWQKAAYPIVVGAIQEGTKGVVQAIMGAGKSILIAEVAGTAQVSEDKIIVVSAPTRHLVDQLSETLGDRCGEENVGRFYTHAKEIAPITVACHASMQNLAKFLEGDGLGVALWIADEAHRTESAQILDTHATLAPEAAIGFTATPYRTSPGDRLSLWERLVYKYGPASALRDRVVVPWRIENYDPPENFSRLEEEEQAATLDEACIQWIVKKRDAGLGAIVCDSFSIGDATGFAGKLVDAGVPAGAIHCRMPRRDILRLIDQLRQGELQALVHVMLLREGVDLPWLRGLVLRRTTGSRVGFAQHVGRALRSFPGKEKAVIFDPHDLFAYHQLSYEAVLGAGEVPETTIHQILLDLQDEEEDVLPLPGAYRQERPQALRKTHIETLIRRCANAMVTCEKMRPPSPQFGGANAAWRRRAVSRNQMTRIRRQGDQIRQLRKQLVVDHLVPEGAVLEALTLIWRAAPGLTQGGASDFIGVLDAIIRAGSWPPEATALLEV